MKLPDKPLRFDLYLIASWIEPGARVLTLKDFRKFAREVGYRILKEIAIETQAPNRQGNIIQVMPNVRATYGIFLIGI